MALGPVTIGDLKRDGKLLEIEWSSYRRHMFEEPQVLKERHLKHRRLVSGSIACPTPGRR